MSCLVSDKAVRRVHHPSPFTTRTVHYATDSIRDHRVWRRTLRGGVSGQVEVRLDQATDVAEGAETL